MKYLDRDSNSMTISAFYELHLLGKFNYNPPCQRKSVWGEEQKSFLIDSILKNFPVPPIFLYRKIDSDTGKESYDVIDGKQRLLSIIAFIGNEIALPDDFGDGAFGDEGLNGKYFKDLKEHKAVLWKYKLAIEYVESDEINIINSVFDRLNRNGVTLNPQELRKAKYNASELYKYILELKEHVFWKNSLIDGVKSNRLEDDEFISDILFYLITNQIINSNKGNLDRLYDKYCDLDTKIDGNKIRYRFIYASNKLLELDLDIKKYKIYGVSHLYTLWNTIIYCIDNNIDIKDIKDKLDLFYKSFRENINDTNVLKYKEGMARDVKSKSRREYRFIAIKDYLNI
jgi:hypothetical protein